MPSVTGEERGSAAKTAPGGLSVRLFTTAARSFRRVYHRSFVKSAPRRARARRRTLVAIFLYNARVFPADGIGYLRAAIRAARTSREVVGALGRRQKTPPRCNGVIVVATNYARRGYALYIFASQILPGAVDFGLARAHERSLLCLLISYRRFRNRHLNPSNLATSEQEMNS